MRERCSLWKTGWGRSSVDSNVNRRREGEGGEGWEASGFSRVFVNGMALKLRHPLSILSSRK